MPASVKTTHLHHADLDAGTGLTRDGLDNRRAAVGVLRPDRQEEGLGVGNGSISNKYDGRAVGSVRRMNQSIQRAKGIHEKSTR